MWPSACPAPASRGSTRSSFPTPSAAVKISYDEDNVALVNALLGRTPSPTKRKAPAAAEPDTQYLDSPGFLPPHQKRSKTDVVDLTAED